MMTKTRIRHAGWTLRIEPGASLLPPPAWDLRQVRVGPAPRDPGYDHHLARTRGSTVVWGDEWRFGDDGRLLSLIWTVPERAAPAPADLGPVEPAALVLEELAGELSFTETRAFDGHQLVCGRERPPTAPRSFLVAPDLTVVIDGDAWWGWRLARPLAHLPEGPGPRALGPLVARWFDLMSDDSIEALEEGDPSLKMALTSLRAEAEALGHPAAERLSAEVGEVLKNFYG